MRARAGTRVELPRPFSIRCPGHFSKTDRHHVAGQGNQPLAGSCNLVVQPAAGLKGEIKTIALWPGAPVFRRQDDEEGTAEGIAEIGCRERTLR